MFYGPKLELMTEISTTPHSDTLRIDDTITNRGDDAQGFQILYHANYGPPLLEAGARFLGAVETVTPFNDHAAASVDDYTRYTRPDSWFLIRTSLLHHSPEQAGWKDRDRPWSIEPATRGFP